MTARDNLIARLQSSRQIDSRTLEAHIVAIESETASRVRDESARACYVLAAEQALRHRVAVASGDDNERADASSQRQALVRAAGTIVALGEEYHPARRRTDRSPTANGEKDDSHEVPTEER